MNLQEIDLQEIRIEQELTQKEMADRLGVSESAWYRAERYNDPGPKIAAALEREFQIPMGIWFSETSERAD